MLNQRGFAVVDGDAVASVGALSRFQYVQFLLLLKQIKFVLD